MRVGIFGGTFDPPHAGHLIVAECVREKLSLDKVIFIPSATSPHKLHVDIVEAHHRLEMLTIAVQGNRYFEVSEVEIQRGGVSFTIDTLTAVRKSSPDDSLHLLIGMDNLADFPSWKSPEGIRNLAEVVVMTRPGSDLRTDHPAQRGVSVCVVPEIGISSSDIRSKVAQHASIRYLVPAAVEMYIAQHHLYRKVLEK